MHDILRPPKPQLRLGLHDELIVDNFAGGGGASLGIEMALGRSPDIAINHDPMALAMHAMNHPQTQHLCEDVFAVDPVLVCAGRPVGLAWFSPDCKHHSKAKGGKPRDKKIRGLAWVAVRWAATVRPRVIVLENVEEFKHWGPLLANNQPCPRRKGRTFQHFVGRLRKQGYHVEWRELRASELGTPTIRRRLFLVARCDGKPIHWPAPTHGPGLKPFLTAASCIDWTIPCPSIFLTPEEARPLRIKRPLAEATLRRIARGLFRYVIDAADPFIVPYHSARRPGDDRVRGLGHPLPVQTTENRFGLVVPVVASIAYGETSANGKHRWGIGSHSAAAPLGTVTGSNNFALLAAHITKFPRGQRGQRVG